MVPLHLSVISSPPPLKPFVPTITAKCTSMAQQEPLLKFPHLSSSGEKLMEGLLSTVESRLGPYLNPSFTPSDVRSFRNQNGSSQGSVNIRGGNNTRTMIDFILGSWIHCKMPHGILNIFTLVGMLNTRTDTPHLLLEVIQTGPSSLVLVLDLLPRKDLVLHSDYLKHYYEDAGLDPLRQQLEKKPFSKPYISSSLYIRSVVSPTAILFQINSDSQMSMDEIVGGDVEPVVKQVVETWLRLCLEGTGRELEESDRERILRRDNVIKTIGIEVDLLSNMPRLFGPDVTARVVDAFRKGV
ncbi:hypothetical protein AMTRI_Chr04g247490 [Amborella trichopoda]|uniref:Red chlorophyll catabolite reductase n=1 Tax=Amborella trichopoda TaxID=13333 RepID=W1NDQ8_AMBTC|nr:red chlorophyll catabolite reductase [Amborella trichopoda]ERM93473.1 hypothetical protein AMTR_s00132p00112670 [Amborella trichopoda]|eukprot:XP_006826236.1 red chlorophyll catabolite reductase [Amborella trichopoda]